MNKYKKLGINTIFLFLGNVGSKLITFLLLPFYTKYLTPELYGEVNMITMTIIFLSPLMTFQLSTAVFRFSNQKSKEKQDQIVLIALSSVVFFILVSSLFLRTFVDCYNLNIYKYYYSVIFIVLFSYINNVLKERLRINSQIKLYSVIGIIEATITVVFNIFLVPKELTMGMIKAILYSHIVVTIILLYISRIKEVLKIKYWNYPILKEMLKYSLPLIPNAIIWNIIELSDRSFLKYYFGLKEVGLYSLSNKIPVIMTLLFNIFYSSLQITALENYKKNDFKEFLTKIFYFLIKFQILIFLVLVFIIKDIIELFFTVEYTIIWKYIPLLLLGTILNNSARLIGVIYLIEKNSKKVLKISLQTCILNIILNYILIPKYSIIGAIFATIISYFSMYLLRERDCKNYIDVDIKIKCYIFGICLLSIGSMFINEKMHRYAIFGSFIFGFLILERDYIKELILRLLKKEYFNEIKKIF